MKKLVLGFLFTFFILISNSQTLFTYGNHAVSSSEFLNAYNKNKTATTDSAKDLRDYLNLYINFKLKVQAAKEMQLDTLPSLEADLQNFRSQIQDGYLNDEKEVNKLIDEAFKRSQTDIHAVYYFVPTNENTDSLKALKIIGEVAEKLKKNKPDKDILSTKNGLKAEKGDLGFITVFSLPYEFENIIYGLKPGQSSIPHHTKKGWYIFKNQGERKAVGKITVAQILFAVPEGDVLQKEKIKKLADSVYTELQNGSDFSTLAKQFSDDRTTFMNGGIMPEFGTAKYDSIFENHAFSLQNDRDISRPFETKFGYHIIKRISATPIPTTKNDETFVYNLKQEVLNDNRIEIAKKKFLSEIFPIIGYKKNKVNEQNLWRITDSSLMNNKNILIGNVNENTTLFSYNNDSKVKVRDWILYIKNSNKIIPGEMHESYKKIFTEFINSSAISNYASRLQNYSSAFKKQIEEFKEGNLLFEIMQRKVWNKASADTSGLKGFYKKHHEKYFWNVSAEAIIFSCSNKSVADNSILQLKKGKRWREIVSENSTQIQADSGRFELGQIPVIDRTNFTSGLITMSVINKNDGTALFSKILKMYPAHEPRSFEDSRGLVINDYQNYLDQKWVEELMKKYPVKVNEKVFKS
ncbi:MAG: peptidylprolyl isomerase, partial [Ginsengibacter sp.]